jgi:hypothetical protein
MVAAPLDGVLFFLKKYTFVHVAVDYVPVQMKSINSNICYIKASRILCFLQ